MVLSPSSIDLASRAPWLSRICRALALGQKDGVIVLITDAAPEQLRALAVALHAVAKETGDSLHLCLRAPELLDIAPRSVVILLPAADDAAWLNEHRPLFAERRLRVVLWAEGDSAAVLRRRAPDFFDWISHVVSCPAGVPSFATASLRQAPPYPGVCFRGDDAEVLVQETFADAEVARLDIYDCYGKDGHANLLDHMRREGWLLIHGVEVRHQATRIRWAMAESRRRGRVMLVEPGSRVYGWWPVSEEMLGPEAAAAMIPEIDRAVLVAVMLDLEPDAVMLAAQLASRGLWRDTLVEELAGAADPGGHLARQALAHGLVDIHNVVCWDAPSVMLRALWRDSAVIDERNALVERASKGMHTFWDQGEPCTVSGRELVAWVNSEPVLTGHASGPRLGRYDTEVYLVEALLRGSDESVPWPALVSLAIGAGYPDIAQYWAESRKLAISAQAGEPELGKPHEEIRRGEELYKQARQAKERGALGEAMELSREAEATLRSAYGEEHRLYPQVIEFIAECLSAQKQYKEAERALSAAIALWHQRAGRDTPLQASAKAKLALVLAGQGEYADAKNLAFQARELAETLPDAERINAEVAGVLSPIEQIADWELLQRWREGDRLAGAELLHRHSSALRQYLYNMAFWADTEELVQETFFVVLKSRSLDKQRRLWDRSFRTYLIHIARHALVDYVWRRRIANEPLQKNLLDGSESPDNALELDDEVCFLLALQQLPADLRIILELNYWKELPVTKIAEVLGLSEDAVRGRLRRAKDMLRKYLVDLGQPRYGARQIVAPLPGVPEQGTEGSQALPGVPEQGTEGSQTLSSEVSTSPGTVPDPAKRG